MRIIIWLALLLLSSGALASDWYPVSAGSSVTAHVDRESVRFKGSIAKVWIKWTFDSPQEVPNSYPTRMYQTSKSLELYNCPERTSATSQATYYSGTDGTGEVVGSISVPPASLRFDEVVPDTMGETILKYACSQKRPAK